MKYLELGRKGESGALWYVISFLLVFLGGWQIVGTIPVTILAIIAPNGFISLMNYDLAALHPNLNVVLFVLLFSFVPAMLSLFIAIKYIHKRKWKTLITTRNKIDWGRMFFAFLLYTIVLSGITLLSVYLEPDNIEWNFQADKFGVMVLVAIVLVPIQCAFEELFVRGFIMQWIGTSNTKAWVPVVVTSLVFGVLHLMNPEIKILGYEFVFYYILVGLFFGIVVVMDGGLELSIGLHTANNLTIVLLMTKDWTALQTYAIFKDVSEPSFSISDLLLLLIIYPILLFVFKKKYNWGSFKTLME